MLYNKAISDTFYGIWSNTFMLKISIKLDSLMIIWNKKKIEIEILLIFNRDI